MLDFITIRVLDIVDVLLVAFLMYQLYSLIRGTVAFNIVISILFLYVFWLLVKFLDMKLLSLILGQFIGVGVIALIIVFQQEIRRFLLFLGTRYFTGSNIFPKKLFMRKQKQQDVKIKSIYKACVNLSNCNTGALIVITRFNSVHTYSQNAEILNADTSSTLLECIFRKDSPLHDGAVIIENDKIYAARCVLPVSERPDLPVEYGLRHRAGLGMSEDTDAFIIIVSEATGNISIAEHGKIETLQDKMNLHDELMKEFGE